MAHGVHSMMKGCMWKTLGTTAINNVFTAKLSEYL